MRHYYRGASERSCRRGHGTGLSLEGPAGSCPVALRRLFPQTALFFKVAFPSASENDCVALWIFFYLFDRHALRLRDLLPPLPPNCGFSLEFCPLPHSVLTKGPPLLGPHIPHICFSGPSSSPELQAWVHLDV